MTRGRFVAVVLTLIIAVGVVTPSAQGRFWVLVNGALRYTGIASATVLQAGNGSTSAPSYGFLSEPNTGLKWRSGSIDFVTAGAVSATQAASILGLSGGVSLGFSSGDITAIAADTKFTRAGVGSLLLQHATAASTAEFQVSGGSGGFISAVKALTELTTIAAAATTNTAIQIPANAVVLGVSVRVVTVIPTAATFTVTSATPTKTWNTAAVSVAATSTDPGTLGAPSFQTTASAITITPNLTPGAATGQVRVTIFYYTITPPSS